MALLFFRLTVSDVRMIQHTVECRLKRSPHPKRESSDANPTLRGCDLGNVSGLFLLMQMQGSGDVGAGNAP